MPRPPRITGGLRGCFVAAVVLVGALYVSPEPAQSRTLRTDPGAGTGALELAVAASTAGDTIVVSPGEYKVHGVEITQPLTIIGEGGPVLDAGGKGEILTVRSAGVTITGLELRNVGTSFMEDRAAIKIINAADCRIVDNRILNGFFGIYLENSERCAVQGNEIHGTAVREATSANGIHLWHCRSITIAENTITGHRDGIYLEFVENSLITRNHSEGNLRYGLHFMFSHENDYVENVFVDNGVGVAVMYSQDVTMTKNRFEHNWGGAAYGLLLKEIKDSEVTYNHFYRNTVGVYSEGSNRVKVTGNEFVENGYGVKIMANSMDNLYSHNNFIGNEFDVATNSRQNFNTFRSNYWSDYRGYDLDGDGFGDVPHHPVSLFSLLVEKEPSGVILMNSLFVKIIDAAERVMPVFTPETLVDDLPLIHTATFEERD